MKFTVESIEFMLLVLIRLSAFVMSAPFLGYTGTPVRVKLTISVVLMIIVMQMITPTKLEYMGIIGYSALIIKEACVGLVMGFMANMCLYIINFAGQMIDVEMGLSMASLFDPLMSTQSTISGTMYLYFVMLIMMITNMHYFLIQAIVDSFRYFNIGKAVFSEKISDVMINFMPNFIVIGFRIILPMFGCMLLINVVLGVLAKAAPQMNMFVVGMQIKVLVGIIILLLLVEMLPGVAMFIIDAIKDVTNQLMGAFTPK